MKLLCVLLILTSLQVNAWDMDIVQKGSFEVWCDDTLLSSHNTYRKALQSAISADSICSIIQPKIDITPKMSNIDRYLVTVSWLAPTQREDGTELKPDEISHYTIFLSRSDSHAVSEIEVLSKSHVSFVKRYMLAPGAWSFSATATDINGLESKVSLTVTMNLPKDL